MSVFAICVCRYYNAVLNEDESEYSSSLCYAAAAVATLGCLQEVNNEDVPSL